MNKNILQYFVSSYLLFTAIFLGIVLAFNFVVDPYQYYRPNSKHELYWNDRWQVAGFIKSFDYNQVVVGTSMTQNFSLEHLKQLFNTKPIRLSIAGATIQEQSAVLRAAIRTGKVKHVIWGLDQCYLNYELGKYQDSFPLDFYLRNYKGHIKYLLNKDVLNISTLYLKRILFRKPVDNKTQYETYNSWFNGYVFSKDIILKEYYKTLKGQNSSLKSSVQTLSVDEGIKNLKVPVNIINNLEHDIISIIKTNPDINFIIFFPPYSLAKVKLMDLESQKNYAKIREYIMVELTKYKNVSFFDFETYLPIVANLDNYKDFNHYSPKVNNLMADFFYKEVCKVNPGRVDIFQDKFFSLNKENFYN